LGICFLGSFFVKLLFKFVCLDVRRIGLIRFSFCLSFSLSIRWLSLRSIGTGRGFFVLLCFEDVVDQNECVIGEWEPILVWVQPESQGFEVVDVVLLKYGAVAEGLEHVFSLVVLELLRPQHVHDLEHVAFNLLVVAIFYALHPQF